MEDEIYFQSEDGLIALSESLFDSEDVLQETLADNPELLAGEEMTPSAPRNWALITREMDVPDDTERSSRWSADHLFIDQDAIPTIVEVKRSQDTRIRRKVAGQMLDYAAHARNYWSADDLQEEFEQTHEENVEAMYERLGVSQSSEQADGIDGQSPGEFWEEVESNLRSSNLRLLFVADEVPHELQEIVEYLNEQMRDTEVFAIQVSRYEGGTEAAYVPSLYGKTTGGSKSTSTASTPPSYEGDDFLGDVKTKEQADELTTEEAEALREVYRFVREDADAFEHGGSSNVTVKARWDVIGGTLFSLNGSGGIDIPSSIIYYEDNYSGQRADTIEGWLQELGEISPEFDFFENDDQWVHIDSIADHDRIEAFKDACRELVSKCEAAEPKE